VDKRTHSGPQWRKIKAGLETLPLYIREGSEIALSPDLQYVDEKPADAYEIRISQFEHDSETNKGIYDVGRWIPVCHRAKQESTN
jgi:alpha-glucosidase (family GH31 glycosyl hydrolase)